MRKYIIVYIALCLHIAARGQTIADIDLSGLPQPTQAKALRYWMDDDTGSIQTTGTLNGRHTVDVSSLLDGLHTIHYQIIDSEDNVGAPYSAIFLKIDGALPMSEASTLRYWFDDDANVSISNANAGVRMLDVSPLTDGLHTLHYQVVDAKGTASHITSGIFLKMWEMGGSSNATAEKLIYWFDDEEATMTVNISSGIMTIDASALTDGLHTIHYLVRCSDGTVTSAYSSIFMRMNIDVNTSVAKSLRYWFDNDTEVMTTSVTGGTQTLDVTHLLDGLHTLHYQIVDDKGNVASPVSGIFLKMAEVVGTTMAGVLRYWFDNDTEVMTTNVTGGTQNIDVSDMQPGLHTLHYQLVDNKGHLASPMSSIFLKMFDKPYEEGQNSITKYQYWLNNNSSTVKTVELGKTANPYTLIALLPMQKEPLRSSTFHFEQKDGKPMMYAKNDLHVRFTDVAGYFTDDSRQFIDYSVSKEVTPVGELQATQTFNKVAENDVRWYTMQVASGDTAAFKLSQPATVQVFAPSGAEVFKTSESASVKWGGIHTWEDGTYYLAVHDVTGSQSTMKLEYMHMDKYDVVDWDVHTVGNGGCSTITFKGNGFRDLYAVDLVIAPGDTIHSVDISHDSDAETAVTFDFTGASLGDYSAVFHFTEEDKPVANVVTVEEARDIVLTTNVSFPSSFLRGTSTTYTVKIKNNGNMTAYRTPIYITIASRMPNEISHVNISGLRLEPVFDGINLDSLSVFDRSQLQTISDEIGDSHYFVHLTKYDETSGDSIYIMSAYFFTDIAPHSLRTISVSLSTLNPTELWCSVPTEYSPITSELLPKNTASRRYISRKEYCCIREKIECWVGIAADVVGTANTFAGANVALGIADCVVGMGNTLLKAVGNVMCSSLEPSESSFWGNMGLIYDGFSATASIAKCASDILPVGKLKKFLEAVQHLSDKELMVSLGLHLDAYSCIAAYGEKKPNCPPNTGGGGGTSTPFVPRDPNDIFGYLSEAGSKFIADSVARVNYTIEFENDTTFATAAAHTIVIRDTLDSRIFDLTKFLPTGVRIGSHEVFLDNADVVRKNNVTSFVKTIDMRPEINVIAQVEGEFNHKKGTAQWTFTSLDPMTMEPTYDLMQGILPVNFDGTSGIGEVMFEVGVKSGKADGTEIKNRAGIIFDYEAQILTPTWTNVVDAVPPTSSVTDCTMVNDSTLRIFADGFDARSGVWKYEWYVQHGENAPWWKEGETESPSFDFHFFPGFDYGLCVVVTDSAGNVEKKQIARERLFKSYGKDYEDGVPEVLEAPSTKVPADGDVYDLSGRKRSEPQENDINIINKKKVFIQRKKQ